MLPYLIGSNFPSLLDKGSGAPTPPPCCAGGSSRRTRSAAAPDHGRAPSAAVMAQTASSAAGLDMATLAACAPPGRAASQQMQAGACVRPTSTLTRLPLHQPCSPFTSPMSPMRRPPFRRQPLAASRCLPATLLMVHCLLGGRTSLPNLHRPAGLGSKAA